MKSFSGEYPINSEVLAILDRKYPGHEDCLIMPFAQVRPFYEMGCINHHNQSNSHFVLTPFEMNSIRVHDGKIYAKLEIQHTRKARLARWLANWINNTRVAQWAAREGWESISISREE